MTCTLSYAFQGIPTAKLTFVPTTVKYYVSPQAFSVPRLDRRRLGELDRSGLRGLWQALLPLLLHPHTGASKGQVAQTYGIAVSSLGYSHRKEVGVRDGCATREYSRDTTYYGTVLSAYKDALLVNK